MKEIKTKTLSWKHFNSPDPDDIELIKKAVNLHPLTSAELTRLTHSQKVETYDGYIYMVLHFPIFDEKSRQTFPREVDFIFLKNELITVIYDNVSLLDEMLEECADKNSCPDIYNSKTPIHLFYHIARKFYSFALRELEHVHENIDKVEYKIFFEKQGRHIIEELAIARKDLIDFRRSIKLQRTIISSLNEPAKDFYGPSTKIYLNGLVSELTKVWDILENAKETLDSLYDNNVALLNIKQNETMRMFTIMAFITFPLVLLAGIFGMNTVTMPIVGSKYDFWKILSIMFVGMVVMASVFKKKKWL